jgi:hypothetical protein
MAEWFVVRKGKEHGPFQDAQLKSLATSGKLKEEDQVRRSDQKSTVAAKSIGGLFGPALSLESTPPAPASPPAATPKKSGIWMKVVYFLMFCVIVGQVLKMIGLMTGKQSEQQVVSRDEPEKVDTITTLTKKKVDPGPLTLTKGSVGPESEPLTADYLPRLDRPITFIDSMQDPRNGEPIIKNRTVLKPVADGYETTDYDLMGIGPPITKYISQEERAGAIWYDNYPLVYIGATAGDSWVHKEKPDHRFVFIGFRGAHNRDAVIEMHVDNAIRDRSGSLTRFLETVVLRKGEGIMLWRSDATTDGVAEPHPDRVMQRAE